MSIQERSPSGVAFRSVLFVPGMQPNRIAKAVRAAPDAVIVDLEDAVPAADKTAARILVSDALRDREPAACPVLVRINPVSTAWFADDVPVAALADGVVLPKYEHVEELRELRTRLGSCGQAEPIVVVGLESGRGVADSRALLAASGSPPAAAYFGAEDYIADLGGRRTPDGAEVLWARSAVCLAAHLSGVSTLDQAVVAVRDDEQFRRDAEAGRAIGYSGKICVHPRQVELAHSVFTPSAAEIEHAEAVLEAASAGVAVVDGQMVDEVHLRMARKVRSLASRRTPDQP
jgi:citrate lyase subunit beta/citryl-CoA lyase